MKKLILPLCFILLFTVSCSSEPEEEINVETAIAEMNNEEALVATAVAEMNATAAAESGNPLDTQAPPTETPAPSPTPSICSMNQVCQSTGIGLSVNSTEETTEIGRHHMASDGYKFVNLEITLYNYEQDSTSYYSTWFTLIDANGLTYIAKTFALEPELLDGTLNKGENVTAYIAFEVPENTELSLLTYLPVDSFIDYETLQIDLSS